jgi:hypothetical protein
MNISNENIENKSNENNIDYELDEVSENDLLLNK